MYSALHRPRRSSVTSGQQDQFGEIHKGQGVGRTFPSTRAGQIPSRGPWLDIILFLSVFFLRGDFYICLPVSRCPAEHLSAGAPPGGPSGPPQVTLTLHHLLLGSSAFTSKTFLGDTIASPPDVIIISLENIDSDSDSDGNFFRLQDVLVRRFFPCLSSSSGVALADRHPALISAVGAGQQAFHVQLSETYVSES